MVMAFLGEVAASERRITYAITIWTPRWPITAVVSCGPRLLFERTHAFTHARVILSSAMVPVESVETCCAIRDPRGGIDPALKMYNSSPASSVHHCCSIPTISPELPNSCGLSTSLAPTATMRSH